VEVPGERNHGISFLSFAITFKLKIGSVSGTKYTL
jgi:hypothetical protein